MSSNTETGHEVQYHWMCPHCEKPYFGNECGHNGVPTQKLILAIEDETRLVEEHEHDVQYVAPEGAQ